MISKGMYCYDERGICPHFKSKDVGGVSVTWCSYLNSGSTGNVSDDDFEKLMIFHKTDESGIFELYPLDLLWDQVKECGENEV